MIGWAIEALVASTLLMLLVLALRGPVRRNFGAGIAYALWVLPVARLLLPPIPGEGRLTPLVAPLIERLTATEFAAGILNPAHLPPQVADNAVLLSDINLATTRADMAVVPPVLVDQGAPVMMVVAGLWLIGAVLFIGWHVIRYRRFVGAMLAQTRSEAIGPVRVIETHAANGPLAFGIWRKYIAFPSDFATRYDADEQALALAHELTHHARGDLIANWVALVVLALHWFNPVAWRAFRAFRADQEMACDEQVLAGRGAAVRHAYGRAIVKSAHGGAVSAACHLHTINELKGRLRMLSKDCVSTTRMIAGGVAVAAVAMASLGLTASGTQAAERLSGLAPVAADLAAPVAPTVPTAAEVSQAPAAPQRSADLAAPSEPAKPAAPAAPEAAPAKPQVEHRAHFIIRTRDGAVETFDVKGDEHDDAVVRTLSGRDIMVFAPHVTTRDCKDADGKPVVKNEVKEGKPQIIICRNRIAKMSADARRHAEQAFLTMRLSKDFEWNARRSALEGVKAARQGIIANRDLSDAARSAALKGIDQAIAELEADAAKAK